MGETTSTEPSKIIKDVKASCPDDAIWCDAPDEYPEEQIMKAVIKQKQTFKNICGLTTSYIKPRAAKNKDGEYRFIVNHPDGADEYLQVVRVSTCNSNDEQCGGGIIESAGLGLETKCQQEFSDHKLVALSATGEELVVEEFRFPSCCTCLIRETW